MNVDEAVETLKDDYWNDVKQVAKELAQNIRDGDYSNDDSFTEAMESEVQGHSYVKNPWSLQTIRFSTNREAYKDCGSLSDMIRGKNTDIDELIDQTAYWAFRADVVDELTSEHGIGAHEAVSERCNVCWEMKNSCDCCGRCEKTQDNCDCCHRCSETSNDCECCNECESLREDCTYCCECSSHECTCEEEKEEEAVDEDVETPKPSRKPDVMHAVPVAKKEEEIDKQDTVSWYK